MKSQDVIYLFMSAHMSSSAATHKHSWAYFKENLPRLLEMYGAPHSNLFQHCLKASTKRFCSGAYVEEIEVCGTKRSSQNNVIVGQFPEILQGLI
jgi:hypothetical protein